MEESRFHRMECTTTPITVETEHKLIFLSELFMLPRCLTQNLSGVTKALGFLGSPLATELAFLFLETLAHIASTIVLELSVCLHCFSKWIKLSKINPGCSFCIQSLDRARLYMNGQKIYIQNG